MKIDITDIFGIKRRKAIKEIEARENKKIADIRFGIIKSQWQIIKDRADKIVNEKDSEDRKKVDETNTVCPKCKSTNVNDRIKRIQGEFSGSGSISGGSIFGTGYISGSSHSKGSIDTNEVNKCNDCNNEWKKAHRTWNYRSSIIETKLNLLNYLLIEYNKAKTAVIDKNDLDETFTSDEEKRTSILKSIESGWLSWKPSVQEFFKDIYIETIEEIVNKEIWAESYDEYERRSFYKYWDEKVLEEIGIKHIKIS